jgi:peptidoglycan/LPS O-acetylase OafA/YrhL
MTTSARAATGPTTGFLEESPGNRSSMRLMCLLALLASIAFAAVTMVRSAPILTRDSAGQETLTAPPRDDTGMLISFAFLLAAFAPKVVQKFAEQRLGDLNGSGLRELLVSSVASQPAAAVASTLTEDPGLRQLLEEVERLRAEIARSRTPIQVSAATPVAPPAAALTPLERIRLGGSL